MAAAQGIIKFDTPAHNSFTYSIYFDDTAGAPVRFAKDGKAGATSPDFLQVSQLCGIEDICLEGATAKTTTVIKINDLPVTTILNALHLAAIVSRPVPGIFVWPGQKLTMVQVA